MAVGRDLLRVSSDQLHVLLHASTSAAPAARGGVIFDSIHHHERRRPLAARYIGAGPCRIDFDIPGYVAGIGRRQGQVGEQYGIEHTQPA